VPSVALADPLWWVVARLRRILTGLLMLALTLGATAELHGAAYAPSTEARSSVVAPVIATASSASSVASAPVVSAVDLSTIGTSTIDTLRELDVRWRVDSPGAATVDPASGPRFSTDLTDERAGAADLIPSSLSLTDLAAAGTASDPATTPVESRGPAALGQRAPPVF